MGDRLLVDGRQVELRPAEHLEPALWLELSPAQIDEAFAPLSMDEWAAEVHVAVAQKHHVNRDPEDGFSRVTRDEIDDLFLTLNTKVDRLPTVESQPG